MLLGNQIYYPNYNHHLHSSEVLDPAIGRDLLAWKSELLF